MKVITIESETFKQMAEMVKTMVSTVQQLAEENKMLKLEPLMTVDEVAAYTRLSAYTIKEYKDKIGCSQPGGKILLFRKQDVDRYIDATYRKSSR